MVNIEAIIWYGMAFEVVMANIIVWFMPGFPKWYKKKMPGLSKTLPLTKGWALVYLGLAFWVGYSLYRLSVLPW